MKKLFFLAVAVSGLLLTSCSKENSADHNGEVISFNVATEDMGTRAFGNGYTVESLIVAVYDVNDNNRELSDIRYIDTDAFAGDVLSTKVEFRLVSGKTYDFVFYAYNSAAENHYTFDPATGILSINYTNIKANNENLDAFVAYRREVNDGKPKDDVILTRPFAQVNVACNDYDAAVKAGLKATKTSMKLQAFKTLNIKTGRVGEPSMIDVIFGEEAMPTATLKIKDGREFKLLTMNYILVDLTEENNRDDNDLITCTFSTDDSTYAPRTWEWVPVKRNYQTNIVGDILTENIELKVIIDPIFKDSYIHE